LCIVLLTGCEAVAIYTNENQSQRERRQEPVNRTQEPEIAVQTPVDNPEEQAVATSRRERNRDSRHEYMVTSWYGNQFHGRQTANGETFNMYEYTAAHRTLPFGTRLRLTNEANNSQATVRINDRGPVPLERELDVSFRTAQTLGFVDLGIVRLRVEVLE